MLSNSAPTRICSIALKCWNFLHGSELTVWQIALICAPFPKYYHCKMKALAKILMPALALTCTMALFSTVNAADAEKDNPTKEFMKKYHKAPQGVDSISKKASMGKASPEELKGLAAGYKAMIAAKPPKGDAASWKEKTTKLSAAADALVKGEPDAVARYKEAVNCKACHSEHKPN